MNNVSRGIIGTGILIALVILVITFPVIGERGAGLNDETGYSFGSQSSGHAGYHGCQHALQIHSGCSHTTCFGTGTPKTTEYGYGRHVHRTRG